MALFEDLMKGEGLGLGLGVAVVATLAAPVVLPLMRPLAKGVIKAGLLAYDQGRVALAELNERTGDIVGEARAEIAERAEARAAEAERGGREERRRRRSMTEQPEPAAT